MAAAGGTGIFLANVFGFVVTSALAYFCTAAAGLRLRPRSHPDGFEDGCDMWLHNCAASSSDGIFTKTKEQLCTVAAPEDCSSYFDSKRSSPSLQGSQYIKSKRGRSLGLGGSTTDNAIIANSVSATDKFQLSSRLVVSPVLTLVGCNTLAWTSVYLMCVAVKTARARRSRQGRVASDGVGLDRVGPSANDAGGGRPSMAVGNPAGDVDIAAVESTGNAGIGCSSAANAPSVETPPQAPMASGSLQLAALSPGLVSPPNIRSAKLAGSTSAAEASSNVSFSSSASSLSESNEVSLSFASSLRSLSGSEDVVVPYLNMVSDDEIGDVGRMSSPTIPSGGATPTGQKKCSVKGGERGTSLSSPTPAKRRCRFSSAPSAVISLETKAAGKGIRKEAGASLDPVSSNKASNCLGTRFSEAERELSKMIGFGQPNVFTSANPAVAASKSSSTHSSAPVSDSPGSASPASDISGSQARVSTASVSDVPSSDVQAAYALFLNTPSTPSTTYSACWNVLEEGYTKSTSLHGVSDLEIDVASSAGSGGTGTQDIDSANGETPDGEMSAHDLLGPRTTESKEDSLGWRTSWVAPPTGSPVGLNVRRPGVGAIQFAGFNATRSQLSGLRGGVKEAKGPFAYEMSRSGESQEIEPHACSDGIGEDVAEVKGEPACERVSAGVEPELTVHALSDVIGGGGAEWDGPGDRLPPSSDYEVQEVARLHEILDEALRVLGSDE